MINVEIINTLITTEKYWLVEALEMDTLTCH